MRLALTVWKGRISPVFDVARRILFLDIENKVVVTRNEETLDEIDGVQKVKRLAGVNVDVLICGAISKPFYEMLIAGGINVFPFIAGNVEEVATAYIKGTLINPTLAMPGCCGRFRKGWPGPRCRGRRAR